MSQLSRLPDTGKRTPSPRDPDRWVDLIAFLAVLTLGGVLMAVIPTTAVSIATVFVALGGLYRLWKRSRRPDDDPPDGKP